jgi:hypothetical protein
MVSTRDALANLAHRIRQEHEASVSGLKHGLQHAIAAGRLLIKAKEECRQKFRHGKWLAWVREQCQMPERSAQAYMRVARTFGAFDSANAQRVADLSFRDSLRFLSIAGTMAKDMPAESVQRFIEHRERNMSKSWYHARTTVKRADHNAERVLRFEQQQTRLLANGGKYVERIPERREWRLVIRPEMTSDEYREREKAVVRNDPELHRLQQKHDELSAKVTACETEAIKLEAAAKKSYDKARTIKRRADAIDEEIHSRAEQIIGPIATLATAYTIRCDETTDAEIAALNDEQRIQRILHAENKMTSYRGTPRSPPRVGVS